jgi:hypothetical protein
MVLVIPQMILLLYHFLLFIRTDALSFLILQYEFTEKTWFLETRGITDYFSFVVGGNFRDSLRKNQVFRLQGNLHDTLLPQ